MSHDARRADTERFEAVWVTRTQLRDLPAFADFGLFKRANDMNPFPLTGQQWTRIRASVTASPPAL